LRKQTTVFSRTAHTFPMHSTCLPPLARSDARILVLGSLPGQMSLQLGQYYAKPQNAFWRIMAATFHFPPNLPYPNRVVELQNHKIAAWEVCASAYRPGSLDSNISQVVVNDFKSFFQSHPLIGLICFNGQTAEKLYRRNVLLTLPKPFADIHTRSLPSTSPAHAGMTFAQKLAQWKPALTE
jgi:double-stranded uracil-DNA glycosylase